MEKISSFQESTTQQVIHQAAVAANFHNAVQPFLTNSHEQLKLRDHQPSVLEEIDDYFQATSREVGRSLLVPLPPNAGKSTLTALCVNLAGVGKVVPKTGKPLRALALLPRLIAVKQTMDTYNWLAPHLQVEQFNGSSPLSSFGEVDVLVMTYKAVTTLSDQKWLELTKNIDIVTPDEVHRALGPQIAAQLRLAQQMHKPTILASSATPDFNNHHSTQKVLNIQHRTTRFSEREAIEAGVSNEVCLYAVNSGESIHFTSKRESITEEDMQPLIDRKNRNELILDIMQSMAASGRQGIVQLIPGQNNRHARDIAQAASESKKRRIIDPITGEVRHLRVAALGNFRTDAANFRIIEAFKRGEYDALTFSKYLTEAFDSPLGYILSAAPIGSAVDKFQLTGRGARWNELVTFLFDIIDRFDSYTQKRVWTFFDVFGEDRIYQGQKISRRASVRQKLEQDSQGKRLQNTEKSIEKNNLPEYPERFFSERLKAALAAIPRGTVLDELVIMKGEHKEIPPGYIPLAQLPAVQEGLITDQGARYILSWRTAEDGRPLFISARSGAYSQYVLASEADAAIRARYIDPQRKVTRLDIANFLMAEGWPRLSFDAFIHICDEVDAVYDLSAKSLNMDPAEARKVLEHLIKTPFVDPTVELAISSLARAIGQASSSWILKIMRRDSETYAPYLRSRRRGIPPTAYKMAEALDLERAELLLDSMIDSSPTVRQKLGSTATASTIVADIQRSLQMTYWKQKMHPTLDQKAVDNFLGNYLPHAVDVSNQSSRSVGLSLEEASIIHPRQLPEDVPTATIKADPVSPTEKRRSKKSKSKKSLTEPTLAAAEKAEPAAKTSPELVPETEAVGTEEIPSPLDHTFLPSKYGRNWREYAACQDEDPELFFPLSETTSAAQQQINQAKTICSTCVVKGNCLHFSLFQASDGIAGGFTDTERRSLSERSRLWLKRVHDTP